MPDCCVHLAPMTGRRCQRQSDPHSSSGRGRHRRAQLHQRPVDIRHIGHGLAPGHLLGRLHQARTGIHRALHSGGHVGCGERDLETGRIGRRALRVLAKLGHQPQRRERQRGGAGVQFTKIASLVYKAAGEAESLFVKGDGFWNVFDVENRVAKLHENCLCKNGCTEPLMLKARPRA